MPVQSLFTVSQMENITYFQPPPQITYLKMASIFVNMSSMTRIVPDIKLSPVLESQILLKSHGESWIVSVGNAYTDNSLLIISGGLQISQVRLQIPVKKSWLKSESILRTGGSLTRLGVILLVPRYWSCKSIGQQKVNCHSNRGLITALRKLIKFHLNSLHLGLFWCCLRSLQRNIFRL